MRKELVMAGETMGKERIVVTKSKPTNPGSHKGARPASHKAVRPASYGASHTVHSSRRDR
jgi:hypothetical protein